MNKTAPQVFTIAPGGNFLEILAQQIHQGFPLSPGEKWPPLFHWTILLPTRRAAKELARILYRKSGQRALLLPTISAIGDLEEAEPSELDEPHILPQALSSSGQLLLVFALIEQWIANEPVNSLAQEISYSPTQKLALAQSLLKLIDQIETEEVGLEKIDLAYEADLSDHRNSILSLLSLIKTDYQKKLIEFGRIGKSERRSRLIKLEAAKISSGKASGPIIAAGSTGTIPATRELLKAIAYAQNGAVILPGLDQQMDEKSWASIGPDHPQHTLKNLLSEIDIARPQVVSLSDGNRVRNIFSSEIMRPTETTEMWQNLPNLNENTIQAALNNLHMIAAPDRHLEARSIALILRQSLEIPHQTAALVTPDRDLAKRVKTELRRWNIDIADSAGEPLSQFGRASLVTRLIDTIAQNFSFPSILNLLHHESCNFGIDLSANRKHLADLEIAILRNYELGARDLKSAFDAAYLSQKNHGTRHSAKVMLGDNDWIELRRYIDAICACLDPLKNAPKASLKSHLESLEKTLEALAPNDDRDSLENQTFMNLIVELKDESSQLSNMDLQTACAILASTMSEMTLPNQSRSRSRLAIYGVLEARMIPCDVLILGGLNESKWPAQTDPGPWLNRSMRDIFGLQQPEREIGVAAHDFTQSLGYSNVYLTWSKRVEGAPLVPSRWILRLQAILQVLEIDFKTHEGENWLELARNIDWPNELRPIAKPRANPPVSARPTRFSVTDVEKLIRDPYAIYAKRILKLVPLSPLFAMADPALKGTIFHSAINEWNSLQPKALNPKPYELLLAAGIRAFNPYIADPTISAFWYPRFVKMARWISDNEETYRSDVIQVCSEIDGVLDFKILGIPHSLYGRADRIDVMANATARITDYKTGNPPSSPQVSSGLSPQLPLEAAILLHGKFNSLEKLATEQLDYIHIGGGEPPGEIKSISPTDYSNVMELAEQTLAGFERLLADYQRKEQAYLPRVAPIKDEDALDFDHLSRFKEWMLAGDVN